MKVFQTLKNVFSENKTITDYAEDVMKKTDKTARKGVAVCEDINICVFPFLVINEVVVD
jgi:hypothetical protein